MIASLPMYRNTATQGACDRFWTVWAEKLRKRGIDAPMHLTIEDDAESTWSDPALLISQTCGYPYASSLRDKVRLVATPHYAVEGCNGPAYCSWIVVHVDSIATILQDLEGLRVAFNGSGSQSGYNNFRAAIAPLTHGKKFFSETHQTGSHAESMRYVADGKADCAAIDAVSWVLTLEEEPLLDKKLRRMAITPEVPGLPFITSADRSDEDVTAMRNALLDTLCDATLSEDLATLKLCGATVLDDSAYDVCLTMERAAVEAGYPRLA